MHLTKNLTALNQCKENFNPMKLWVLRNMHCWNQFSVFFAEIYKSAFLIWFKKSKQIFTDWTKEKLHKKQPETKRNIIIHIYQYNQHVQQNNHTQQKISHHDVTKKPNFRCWCSYSLKQNKYHSIIKIKYRKLMTKRAKNTEMKINVKYLKKINIDKIIERML